MTEWATLDEAQLDGGVDEVIDRYRKQFGDAVARLEYNIAALSATLLNAHTWAP